MSAVMGGFKRRREAEDKVKNMLEGIDDTDLTELQAKQLKRIQEEEQSAHAFAAANGPRFETGALKSKKDLSVYVCVFVCLCICIVVQTRIMYRTNLKKKLMFELLKIMVVVVAGDQQYCKGNHGGASLLYHGARAW